MTMLQKKLFRLAAMTLIIAGPACAQPVAAVVPTDESSGARANVDHAVSLFLFEAIMTRSRMGDEGLNTKADRFWASALELVTVVRNADPEDAPLFLPVLEGLRRSFADATQAGVDIDAQSLSDIQEALEDQVKLHTSAGAFPDAKGAIQVEVHALRNGMPVDGFYVALDLFGAVPKGSSANTLPNATNPARGAVGPGRYLIRVFSPSGEVGRRVVRIGTTGTKETIDVVLNP